MRVVLAQLAPVPGDLEANLDRVRSVVGDRRADLFVFPELFLTGYRIGDAMHRLALAPGGAPFRTLAGLARRRRTSILVGAPVRHERPGEIENAAVLAAPDGRLEIRGKRFLPTYGPFEEGSVFSAARSSAIVRVGDRALGLQICYDAFFPEVSRELALGGAELLAILSAAPVTSRRLFDRVLPARAVENAVPVVYVNRVGVEDGVVFGGGSQALDARGERLDDDGPGPTASRSEERVTTVEIDLTDAARWRPFRPVLRDVAPHHVPAPAPREGHRPPSPSRTGRL